MIKTGVINLKKEIYFDIVCGECGSIMHTKQDKFICEICNIQRDGKFLESFFTEKYRDKIKKIEITNVNSAKIYFEMICPYEH